MFAVPNVGYMSAAPLYQNSMYSYQSNYLMSASPNFFYFYPVQNISQQDIFVKTAQTDTQNMQNIKRKKFSPEEDEQLKKLVEKMGSKKWGNIAKFMPGRTGRQCRDRYQNYLIPGFFTGQWTKEEDEILLKKYEELGSQWSKMTVFFKNRNANALKNRWNYFISKRTKNKNKIPQNNEEMTFNDYAFAMNFADNGDEKDETSCSNEMLNNPFLFNENMIE